MSHSDPTATEPTQDTLAVAPDDVHENDRVALADARLDGWFQFETGELFKGFPVNHADHVLDIGSGDGGLAGFCAKLCASVCCVDIDHQRLDATLQRLRHNAIGDVEGIHARADQLPIASASKNRIICTEVLEHVPIPAAVLREAHRVGTDDALYLLTVPDARSEALQKQVAEPAYFQEPNHIRVYTREQFSDEVRQAGFDIVEHLSFGFYQSMWLTFYWLSDKTDINDRSHPLLRSWDHTWALFNQTPQAEAARRALDELMPRTQLIIARKSRVPA